MLSIEHIRKKQAATSPQRRASSFILRSLWRCPVSESTLDAVRLCTPSSNIGRIEALIFVVSDCDRAPCKSRAVIVTPGNQSTPLTDASYTKYGESHAGAFTVKLPAASNATIWRNSKDQTSIIDVVAILLCDIITASAVVHTEGNTLRGARGGLRN